MYSMYRESEVMGQWNIYAQYATKPLIEYEAEGGHGYRILPNKRACLNKHAHDLNFPAHISETSEPISQEVTLLISLKSDKECFLLPRPAHLFGKIWYINCYNGLRTGATL